MDKATENKSDRLQRAMIRQEINEAVERYAKVMVLGLLIGGGIMVFCLWMGWI